MYYEYYCDMCEKVQVLQRSVADRDAAVDCPNCANMTTIFKKPYGKKIRTRKGYPLRRIMCRRPLITTSLAKDMPENQMARIMTGGSNSREDWLKWQRQDAKDEENVFSKLKPQEPVDTSFADIDVSGAWTAAHAGTDQLMRWRADNIPVDPLTAVPEGV